jgi:hypothetical protein
MYLQKAAGWRTADFLNLALLSPLPEPLLLLLKMVLFCSAGADRVIEEEEEVGRQRGQIDYSKALNPQNVP